MPEKRLEGWALILGASSGFGAATARTLAKEGMDVCGVHLDRKSTLHFAEEVAEDIKKAGRQAAFYNANAAAEDERKKILEDLKKRGAQVKVFMHSLAFGTLKPFIAENSKDAITKTQMEMTSDVMAHSLVYWVQDLLQAGLLAQGGRIFAMTSEGDARAWKSYGAVSAAKSALESHVRQLAVELAPMGITANAIRAGVTETPALKKIPGAESMIGDAKKRNPHGRLTRPEDIAEAIALFSRPESSWMTGNVLGVDGGEFIAAS